MALLATQDVREALGWAPTRDVEAERLAKIVTAQWEAQTKRLWNSRTAYVWRTELDEFEKVVMLPLYPLSTVMLVSWADGEVEPPDFTTPLTRDTDYVINMDTGQVTILQTAGSNWFFIDWRHPDNWLKFELTGGFTPENLLTTHDQGEAIKEALLVQAVYQYERNKRENVIATSVALGGSESGSVGLRSSSVHPLFRDLARTFRLNAL